MLKVTRGPSQDRWNEMRPLFTQLYVEERKTLKEIQHVFSTQYGFRATSRMYMTRIQRWGLDKKHKEVEMLALVSLALKRQSSGKKSRFRIRGRAVQLDEAKKYFKRKKLTDLSQLLLHWSEGPMPPDLSCSTVSNSPEPTTQLDSVDAEGPHYMDGHVSKDSAQLMLRRRTWKHELPNIQFPLRSPDGVRCMELLLCGVQTYFQPSSLEFANTAVRNDLAYSVELQGFERLCHKAALYADVSNWPMAAHCYDKALVKVSGILRSGESLNFLVCLFVMLGCCQDAARTPFIPAMLRFVSELMQILFPPSHPLCQLMCALQQGPSRVSDMIELCLRSAVGLLLAEGLLLDSRTRIITYGLSLVQFSRGNISKSRALLQTQWEQEELLLGKSNTMTICSMIAIGKCYIEEGDMVHAEHLFHEAVKRIYGVKTEEGRRRLRTHILVHAEFCSRRRKHGDMYQWLVEACYAALGSNDGFA